MRRALLFLTLLAMLAVPAATLGQKPVAPPEAAPTAEATPTVPGGAPVLPDAKAWILVDARDGTQLAGKAPDRELPIASTTKLMTAYLALQRLKPSQKLAAPRYNATDAESLLGLRVGEKLSVRDLLFALVLESANDAAETLAVGVSGSEGAFVTEMNSAALALGLTETKYSTPVGLDSPGNHSSARDLAALADTLLEDPLFAEAADSATATLKTGDRPRRIGSRNLLLNSYPFVTGVKTGHTLDAGYVLVGSGEKEGTTLISVVLGTPSEGARDADTLKLLNHGFSLYERSTPVKVGADYDGPELDYGRGDLKVEATKGIEVSTRPGQAIETEVDLPAELKGGVEQGEPLGEIRVTVDGRVAGASPLVAAQSVGPAGIFRKALSAATGPLILLPLGLIVIAAGLLLAGGRRLRLPRFGRPGAPAPSPGGPPASGGGGDGSDRGDGGDDGNGGGGLQPGRGSNGSPGVQHDRPTRGKSPRTPEQRERMRNKRMERRSRHGTQGGGS